MYFDQHSGAAPPNVGLNQSKILQNAGISVKINKFELSFIEIKGKWKKNLLNSLILTQDNKSSTRLDSNIESKSLNNTYLNESRITTEGA